MYERFVSTFPPQPEESVRPFMHENLRGVSGLKEILDLGAGKSFGGGLVRVHSKEGSSQAKALASVVFPEFGNVIVPIVEDWLGRKFCIDVKRVDGSRKRILLLEPGSGGAFDIDCSIPELLDDEFVNDPVTYLASDLFDEWRVTDGVIPEEGKCVGFKVPIFLGGAGSVENLEVSDRDVYWSLMGQLRASATDLPCGTSIGRVEI